MSKTFFSLVLMLTASMSFAQSTNTDPPCQEVIEANSANIPGPVIMAVGVEIQILQDLRRDFMKARNLLDPNMIENARRSLDESVRAVDEILAGPVI